MPARELSCILDEIDQLTLTAIADGAFAVEVSDKLERPLVGRKRHRACPGVGIHQEQMHSI